MADGKWSMTDDDARRVDLSFSGSANKRIQSLPNYGQQTRKDACFNGNEILYC